MSSSKLSVRRHTQRLLIVSMLPTEHTETISMPIIYRIIMNYFLIVGKKHGLISKPKTESLAGRTINR